MFGVRSARGEFQNSPVDCFERGDDLQEGRPLSMGGINFLSAIYGGGEYFLCLKISMDKELFSPNRRE